MNLKENVYLKKLCFNSYTITKITETDFLGKIN